MISVTYLILFHPTGQNNSETNQPINVISASWFYFGGVLIATCISGHQHCVLIDMDTEVKPPRNVTVAIYYASDGDNIGPKQRIFDPHRL